MTAVILPKLGRQWLKFGSLATAFGGTYSLRAGLGLGYTARGSVGQSSSMFFVSDWPLSALSIEGFGRREEMVGQMLVSKGTFGSFLYP
jgi:hypothetical protein